MLISRCLTQAASLALGLEEHEDIALAHGSLHVADDGAVGLVHELNADLAHAQQQQQHADACPSRKFAVSGG